MSVDHFPSINGEINRILFSSAEVSFQLSNEESTGEWLRKVIEQEEKQLHSLNFIFCSDDYLHRLNIEYLQHDTLTDIITFHYNTVPVIEGDIFISIDRVLENAEQYGISFQKELSRVMVHGVLHLCGYGDKTKQEAELMRQKENEALEFLSDF